jgi:hypothetical protein
MDDLESILRQLSGLELSIGQYYESCAREWPDDRQFWLSIHADELKHAQFYDQISESVREGLINAMPGRRASPAAIKTIQAGIVANTGKVQSHLLSKTQALAIARDLERSVLEKNVTEMIETGNYQYSALAKQITIDTRLHHERIEQKLRQELASHSSAGFPD